jgi:hypothetical protein
MRRVLFEEVLSSLFTFRKTRVLQAPNRKSKFKSVRSIVNLQKMQDF